jgi:plasmid stability protein
MSGVSVRKLDQAVKERLRVRAARHGRSMEAEIRTILTEAVSDPGDSPDLVRALADRFGELGGVDLELPRHAARGRAREFHQ